MLQTAELTRFDALFVVVPFFASFAALLQQKQLTVDIARFLTFPLQSCMAFVFVYFWFCIQRLLYCYFFTEKLRLAGCECVLKVE